MGYQRFAEFIYGHLEERKKENPQFSLRQLSKEIDMNPGFLSSLVTGKRKLTRQMADEILVKMGIERVVINHILASVGESQEPLNLTPEQSDRCNIFVLSIERILAIRQTPILISDLAQVLNRSEDEVLTWVQVLVDLDVAVMEEQMVSNRPHGHLLLHGSAERNRQKTAAIVDLIRADIQGAEQLRSRLPVHFLVASTDEHIQKNVKHYFNAVESIADHFDVPESADNVYLGFMYLLKMTNSKIDTE